MVADEPGSVQEDIPSHGGQMTAHLGLILHVTTNWGDPLNFFRDPNHQASSTWWVRKDGYREQYMDADLRAWAQAAGNDTYDSVETDGTPDVALSDEQLTSVAHIYAWGHQRYGWPFQLAEQPGERGLGWHGMGGQAWGGHFQCPGDLRKAQRPEILRRAQVMIAGGNVIPNPAQEEQVTPQDKKDIIDGVVAVLRHDHHVIIAGDAGHPASLDSIKASVDAIATKVGATSA